MSGARRHHDSESAGRHHAPGSRHCAPWITNIDVSHN
jgi:hypothetical protein